MRVTMIACLAVGATVSLLGSPAAAADDDSFVRNAHALGLYQAADNLILTARSACYLLTARHRDPVQVEQRVQRYLSGTDEQNRAFTVLAVREFCPQVAGAVGA